MLIHVGHHKTGSTSLQSRGFVVEKGFCAPWTVNTGEAIEHFVLTHECRFCPNKVRETFEADARKTAGGKTLTPVISHEDLSGFPVNGRYYGFTVAARLATTFPQARVLIVVREQKALIRSLYGQYIRQDGEWPLSVFLGTGTERPGFRTPCRLDHFEFDLLIERYRTLFGSQNVLVLAYESLQRDPIAFEQRIHDFAGSGHHVTIPLPTENAGLGAFTLSIYRRMNWFLRAPRLLRNEMTKMSLSLRFKEKTCQALNR